MINRINRINRWWNLPQVAIYFVGSVVSLAISNLVFHHPLPLTEKQWIVSVITSLIVGLRKMVRMAQEIDSKLAQLGKML